MITKRDIESIGFTQVQQIGYSQSFTGYKKGLSCFISYRTIIGIYDMETSRSVFTDYFYSVTTSRHRNKFIREHNGVIDNARFNILLANYGLD